jgi:hypothetical protein
MEAGRGDAMGEVLCDGRRIGLVGGVCVLAHLRGGHTTVRAASKS